MKKIKVSLYLGVIDSQHVYSPIGDEKFQKCRSFKNRCNDTIRVRGQDSLESTPHVSTGFSPFFLLYNRQPRLPVDTTLKANFYSNRLILDFANDIAQSIQNNVKRARWFSEQKLEKSKENQEIYYNKGRVPTQINEGDYVYLHTPYIANGSDVPKKFHRPWTGPFKVIKKKSDVNFELEMGNSLAHRIVNVNRLKKVVN
ncbi:hypothetical protein ACTFIU_004107 [Dictyostelium citrinum]